MSSNALRKQRLASSINLSNSDWLLAALQAAHRQIETAFAELGAQASRSAPDLSQFSAMRLRVGQALLAKRQVVGSVASHLISLVSADEAVAVRDLRSRDHRYSQVASEIIRNWTPDAIEHNWSGYCVASSELRTSILSLIAAEKDLFYALLENLPTTESETY